MIKWAKKSANPISPVWSTETKEAEEVIAGSSTMVHGSVATEQAVGVPSTVGNAEGGPLDSAGQTEVATTDGV
jgi:hypothetical protein